MSDFIISSITKYQAGPGNCISIPGSFSINLPNLQYSALNVYTSMPESQDGSLLLVNKEVVKMDFPSDHFSPFHESELQKLTLQVQDIHKRLL